MKEEFVKEIIGNERNPKYNDESSKKESEKSVINQMAYVPDLIINSDKVLEHKENDK